MCDAHPDLEVFRLRLGKALNYEFNEDSQTGVFQRRDPREGVAFSPVAHLILANMVLLHVSRRPCTGYRARSVYVMKGIRSD
jgi:hypothetical protein